MKKVLLLLAKGFEMYEASVFTDVIGWNLTDGDGTTDIVTCGLKDLIVSSFNVKVTPEIKVSELNVEDYAALAIPGGFEEYGFYEDAYNEEFLELIREFHRKGKIIASICVAALPLGKSGILKGKKATTYNMKNDIRQNTLREYGVNMVNEPIAVDGNVITSWNPSTAMDVAFLLLELLTSKKQSDYIKNIMGF